MLLIVLIFSTFQCKSTIIKESNSSTIIYELKNDENIAYYVFAYIGTPPQQFLLFLTTYVPVRII